MEVSDSISETYLAPQPSSHLKDENKSTHRGRPWGITPTSKCYPRALGLRGIAIHASPPRAAGGRCVRLSWVRPPSVLPLDPRGLGVCVSVDNSIPVGLSVWPHPRLGRLADGVSSPALRTPASQVAQAPSGDLCLPREPVQVGLHLGARSPLGPRPRRKRGEHLAELLLALPLPPPPGEVG